MTNKQKKVNSKSISDSECKISAQQNYDAEFIKPMISVIIPTFNRADCIGKTIESVLEQTYTNFEIIVVDDGSTDNTQEVLEPYKDRICYIYQDNLGCAAARNTGIQKAHGQWIAFLDSDDRWHSEYLERQLNSIENLKVNVCFANTDFDYDGNKRFENIETTDDLKLLKDPLDFVMTDNSNFTLLQGMLIKYKLIRRMGGFDERFTWGTDMRFMLQLAVEEPIAYNNQKLVIVDRTRDRERLTENRDMNSAAGKALRNMRVLTYSEMYFRYRKQNKKTVKKIRKYLGAYISSIAVGCCISNENYSARRFALDGMYFGRDLRTYLKCAAVLIFPWLVRRLSRR